MDADHPLRRAKWIWARHRDYAYKDLHNTYAQFRYDFELRSVPRRAPLFVSADQCYMLYVNGRYVSRGPARGYQATWSFDEVDLSEYLREGHNWISVRAYNAGVSNFQYIHQGEAGFICAGKWGRTEIRTGPDWGVRICPAHRRCTARLSLQQNFQEHVDTRLDDQSWIRSPRPPKGWKAAPRCVPFGVMPWNDMEERGIPNLTGEVIPYEVACAIAAGRCAPDYIDWTNIAHGFHAESGALTWRATPSGEVARGALSIRLPAAGRGKLTAVLIDMGRPVVGTLLVDTAGNAGGEVVDFYFTEAVDARGRPVVSGPGEGCEASMAARLILKRGRTRYEFFQMIGHRYLIAIARQTDHPIRLKLALRLTVYPLDVRGRFECDDPVLNDIHRICVQTQQVCMLDSYVDTPWREQAQWWGDALVQSQNTFHLSGDTRLLVRGVRSLGRQEVPNGLTYGHAPTVAHHCILPDFSLLWVISIWGDWWESGDVSLFVEQWPRIQRVLGYFSGEGRGDNGLLRYDERYWLFLDWCDIYKEGAPALLNLWYVLTLEKLTDLLRAAGMDDDLRRMKAEHRRQRKLSRDAFWDERTGLLRDGVTPRGKPVNVHSIHTQTLAILCGMGGRGRGRMVEKRLLPYLLDRPVEGASPSSYWVTYVYGVMVRLGYGAEALAHIRRHWAPMIPYGGTFETFEAKIGDHSCTHAWAAHPIYHLVATLGGIVQTALAWKQVSFRPVLNASGVGRASVVLPTPQGLIRSQWRRRNGRVRGILRLPPGIRADVRLPHTRPTVATGRYEWDASG